MNKTQNTKAVLLPCGEEVTRTPLSLKEHDDYLRFLERREILEKEGKILWKSQAAAIAALRYRLERYGVEEKEGGRNG